MAYSIEAAEDSRIFDKVMLATEDEETVEIGKHYSAEAQFYRSEQTTDDCTAVEDVSCALMRFPNTYGVLDIMVPGITAATSIAAGISSALKFKDKKIAYRDYAENLKNILTAYCCDKGEFSGLDLEAKEELLFDRTEQIIREGYKKLGNIEKGSGDELYIEK